VSKLEQYSAMRTRTAALTLLLASAFVAIAGEAQRESDFAANINAPLKWNTDPAHWGRVISEQSKPSALRIGKDDFKVTGPLIDGLRSRRSAPDRSLGQKILGLPIVRLFVPTPMPNPPGGGKYFRWGESDRPWASIAEASGGAGADNPINHEPRNSLISIRR
jgi:hypothetical protein